MPAIEHSENGTVYWIVYFFGVGYIGVVVCLSAYAVHSVSAMGVHALWPIALLKELLTLLHWALYGPFMEAFVGVFKCSGSVNKLDTSIKCYEGVHIFFVIFSIIMALLLFTIVVLCALFNNETNSTQDHSLAKLDDDSELFTVFFRLATIIYSTFVYNVLCPHP